MSSCSASVVRCKARMAQSSTVATSAAMIASPNSDRPTCRLSLGSSPWMATSVANDRLETPANAKAVQAGSTNAETSTGATKMIAMRCGAVKKKNRIRPSDVAVSISTAAVCTRPRRLRNHASPMQTANRRSVVMW